MLNSPPKISVIIGVLNMQQYLAAALYSVVNQNYPAVELIIMDAGSTDGTIEIIQQYEKYITVWKSEKDNGHADACNKAIKIATGELLCLLNADDILGKNLFHKVAMIHNQNPKARVITAGVQIVEQDAAHHTHILKEIVSPEKLQISLENILFGLPVINARFFHRDIFKEYGEFQAIHADGSYNLSNDRDFLIKLALGGVQSEIIPEPLYLYLSHNESLTFSQKNVIKSHTEHMLLAEKFLAKTTLSSAQRKLFEKWRAREAVYLCLIYLLKLNTQDAMRMLKYARLPHTITWLGQLGNIVTASVFKKLKKLS